MEFIVHHGSYGAATIVTYSVASRIQTSDLSDTKRQFYHCATVTRLKTQSNPTARQRRKSSWNWATIEN